MSKTIPPPECPTMGVEVEFLVPILGESEEDPEKDADGLAPILRVPDHLLETARDYVHDKIQKLLAQHIGASAREGSVDVAHLGDSEAADVLREYDTWKVGDDASVREVRLRLYTSYTPVELTSPVAFARPRAYDEIRRAVAALQGRGGYRCRVNPTCGLHVHVGRQAERVPLGQVRRAAALLLAAEPLLFTLFHPRRRALALCPAARRRSRLARGHWPPEPGHVASAPAVPPCHVYLARDVRFGEEPISARERNPGPGAVEAFLRTREPGHFEPFALPPDAPTRHTGVLPEVSPRDTQRRAIDRIDSSSSSSSTTTTAEEPPRDFAQLQKLISSTAAAAAVPRRDFARTRGIPRIKRPEYSMEELMRLGEELTASGAGSAFELPGGAAAAERDVGVLPAVEAIYAADASCSIAERLQCSESGLAASRSAISFESYRCMDAMAGAKRTIEFRLAEGSLDGEWCAMWARICVGLCRFAWHAPVKVFLEVLANLDSADERGGYDVVDLLDDVALFAEAEYVERRLSANMKDWGLEFEES
ncbi:putative amidoligase enzyme-domain-containing protein [Xylariaceae sp. FL0804]|nr:putative amidoligase enzyme-domain-containing protein [Xylariaceae sp. FL0804]